MGRNYAHPEVLVETSWVAEHLNDPKIRIVESDEDLLLYDTGHVPGAVKLDWISDLQHRIVREYIDANRFAELLSERGIGPETTVVLYGDKANWWACYAFWTFKMFGHKDCRIMNGGRKKWIDEGRPLSKDRPSYPRANYPVPKIRDESHRAFRDDVLEHLDHKAGPLIDVRSPGEYSGELQHMPDYPQEGSLRTGHIPGAVSIPWPEATRPDGTFKSADELWDLYVGKHKLKPDDDVVVYCRIGERSSHTWFVLKYLLGFKHVRNYDGSWTEWGNLVGVPIENPYLQSKLKAVA